MLKYFITIILRKRYLQTENTLYTDNKALSSSSILDPFAFEGYTYFLRRLC